jgi:hypothetical protein
MNAAVARPALFKRFSLAMLSSWVTGPLGAAYLYWVGWGGEPLIIVTLLAISAVAPIQLMMNEFVAAGRAAGRFRVSASSHIYLFLASVAASLLALRGFGDRSAIPYLSPAIIFASVGAALSALLSYSIASRFYAAVLHGRASPKASVLVGSTPGLVTLICFAVAGASGTAALALSAAIMPAIVQQILTLALIPGSAQMARRSDIVLNPAPLLGTVVLLGIAGWATGFLRGHIAERAGDLGAIALVFVNMLGTTVIMISRSNYLSDGQGGAGWSLKVALALGAGSAFSIGPFPAAAFLLAIFSVQLLVAAIISAARTIAHRDDRNSDRQVNLHG